jgi:hypothetical protein
MSRFALLFSLLFVGFSFVTSHAGVLTNGGFEDGLNGWSVGGSGGSIQTAGSFTASDGRVYSPVEGLEFALLESGSPGSTLYQSFDAWANSSILGKAFFATSDYLPFNDFGYVRILEGDNVLFYQDVSSVGDFGSTPWTNFSYTFSTAGSYTVELTVVNNVDSFVASYLGADRIEVVPEPSMLVIGSFLGIGGLIAKRRMKKKLV